MKKINLDKIYLSDNVSMNYIIGPLKDVIYCLATNRVDAANKHILEVSGEEYIISDFHFGHYNIIKYCNRPFNSVKEMSDTIIKNWNSTITKNDDIFFLGDFAMNLKYLFFLNQLNFRKIFWILGNHDKLNKILKYREKYNLNVELFNELFVKTKGYILYLNHFPIKASDYFPNICGHSHSRWKFLEPNAEISEYSKKDKLTKKKILKQPVLNISYEHYDYKPITINEALTYFKGYI